jgi:hypothetical protein
VGNSDWRERMKGQRRAEQKQRRVALAADPRVQAMKQALKLVSAPRATKPKRDASRSPTTALVGAHMSKPSPSATRDTGGVKVIHSAA